MRADVWKGEVSKALIKFIHDNIEVIDRKTKQPVPLKAMVRNPQEKGQKESQIVNPCATIYHYDEKEDRFRYDWVKPIVSKDEKKGTAIIGDTAKPYSLYVQVDFWSDYQTELDLITKQWCSAFDYLGYLEVVDSSGVTRYCTVSKTGYNTSDYNEDGERQFQRTYGYRIWVELDSGKTTEVNIVNKPINLV